MGDGAVACARAESEKRMENTTKLLDKIHGWREIKRCRPHGDKCRVHEAANARNITSRVMPKISGASRDSNMRWNSFGLITKIMVWAKLTRIVIQFLYFKWDVAVLRLNTTCLFFFCKKDTDLL